MVDFWLSINWRIKCSVGVRTSTFFQCYPFLLILCLIQIIQFLDIQCTDEFDTDWQISWNFWSLPCILLNRHKKSYLRFSKFGCWSWDRKFPWDKKHFHKVDPSCSLSKGFASHGYTWQIAHTPWKRQS